MNNKSYYLTSIDGLRALAIILVLFYHVDFEWMKGGFIGVDIFFVISGFLITTNITKDIENKRWMFSTFYLKRIARLFPALFSIILITITASYYVLTPEDLIRLSTSALYTVFSLSNFFFYRESGYFDSSAVTKPLLHAWSLSVEEQFYMAWPFTIFLLLKYGSRKTLRNGLILISVVSVCSAIALNPTRSEMVFFITPFRAYQFGLGALVALSGIALTTNCNSSQTSISLFSVFCILALSISITGNKNIFLTAILPALAASGFIIGSKTIILRSIFASKLFVWIGQRSYSIYLTHWPLIVLWKIKYGPNFDAFDKIVVIFLSILGGFLLHFLVEKRFRLNKETVSRYRFRSLATTSTLFFLIIIVIALYLTNKGYPNRFPEELVASSSNLKAGWDIRQKNLRTGTCDMLIGSLGKQTVADFDPGICIKAPSTKTSYLIIGDSFASGAYLVFKDAYPETYFGQMTIPGCHLIPVGKIADKVCANLFETALTDEEFELNYTGIIITSNWLYTHFEDLEELVNSLTGLDKDIIMVGQRIRFDSRLPTIVLSSFSQEEAYEKANSRILQLQYEINDRIKKKYSSMVKYIDMIELQCPDKCDIFTQDGKIIYLDDSHFSVEVAALMAERLQKKYPNLLQ